MFGGWHSVFKNIYGDPKKKEECIDQIKLKVKGSDPPLAAVNSKYLAVLINNSAVDLLIRPLTEVGRIDATPKGIKSSNSIPTCIEWSNRDDDLILVGQLSGEINLMRIPDEGIEEVLHTDEAEVMWNCDCGSILLASWHPTLENAVLTACGNKFAGVGSSQNTHLILWNTLDTTRVVKIPLFNCYLTSISFNYNGSKVVCTDNLHVTRIIELRAGLEGEDDGKYVLQEAKLHAKARRQNTVYLKGDYIFSTGYSNSASREYALWSDADLSTPIELNDLDSNSGVMFPIYDADINVIYLWGKGDSTIKFFEFVSNQTPPTIKFLSAFQSSVPQLGVAAMPKRGVDVKSNEIMRLFKFHNSGLCEFIPVICPRREQGFSEEVYPPTPGRVPALSLDDWVAGADADPVLISLDTGEVSEENLKGSVSSKKRPKTAIQKVKEITDIVATLDHTSDSVESFKTAIYNIKVVLGLVESEGDVQTNNSSNECEPCEKKANKSVVDVASSENSLMKVQKENEVLEKQGLLNAVDDFVNKNPDEPEVDDGAVPNEWDE